MRRIAVPALGFAALAACAMPEEAIVEGLPPAVASAICAGDHAKALAALGDAPASSPGGALLKGYALEASGKIMAARVLYDQVAQTKPEGRISLTCGDKVLLSGAAVDVAQARLAAANAQLAEMGATQRQLALVTLPDAKEDCRLCRPAPSPQPPAAETPPAPPAPAKAPTAKAPGHAYWAQLAAYRHEAEAKPGWDIFKKKHPKDLKACKALVVKADLGKEKGVYYRLGCDGFATAKAAADFCKKLAAAGEWCMPRQVETAAKAPKPAAPPKTATKKKS